MVEGMSVVYNECNEPTPCLVQHIGIHNGKVMYFGYELGFLNYDDNSMCIMNKQFELLKCVF